jgi:hypothetical protein
MRTFESTYSLLIFLSQFLYETLSGALSLQGIDAIADALAASSVVSSLNVLSNDIGIKLAARLAGILQDNPTLRSLCGNNGNEITLDFSSKNIGAEGAIMLAPEISGNNALVSVNILKADIGNMQAQKLAQILKEHRSLKSLCGNAGEEAELDMSGKAMGLDGAIMFAPELAENNKLKTLKLANNGLGARALRPSWFTEMDTDESGDLDVDEFVTGLMTHDKLVLKEAAISIFEQLDVDGDKSVDFEEFQAWNQEEEQQLTPLANRFLAGVGLVKLGERSKQKKDHTLPLGIISLSDAIMSNAINSNGTLTFIDIRDNAIDDDGKRALGKAIALQSNVQFMVFDGWEITKDTSAFNVPAGLKPADAILLASVISNNQKLSTIIIRQKAKGQDVFEDGDRKHAASHGVVMQIDGMTKAEFSDKALGAADAIIMAAFLPKCKYVQTRPCCRTTAFASYNLTLVVI